MWSSCENYSKFPIAVEICHHKITITTATSSSLDSRTKAEINVQPFAETACIDSHTLKISQL